MVQLNPVLLFPWSLHLAVASFFFNSPAFLPAKRHPAQCGFTLGVNQKSLDRQREPRGEWSLARRFTAR